MFLPCPQCGAKNKMGTIFCRDCGARLDLKKADEELRRMQAPKHGGMREFKHTFHRIRQVCSLVALVVVVLILIGIFLSVPVRVGTTLDAAARTVTEQKFQEVLMPNASGRGAQLDYTFSSTEVTVLANHFLGLEETATRQDDPGFALRPEKLWVELLPSGYVRLVLQARTFKRLSVYNSLVGRFILKPDGCLIFATRSAKVGKVPMPGPLKQVVSDRFRALVEEDSLIATLGQRLDAINVGRDELVLTVKPPPRPARPKK